MSSRPFRFGVVAAAIDALRALDGASHTPVLIAAGGRTVGLRATRSPPRPPRCSPPRDSGRNPSSWR